MAERWDAEDFLVFGGEVCCGVRLVGWDFRGMGFVWVQFIMDVGFAFLSTAGFNCCAGIGAVKWRLLTCCTYF